MNRLRSVGAMNRLRPFGAVNRLRLVGIAALITLLAPVACGGDAKSPPRLSGKLPTDFATALREEQVGSQEAALDRWLALVDAAVAAPDDPWSAPAVYAALDAIVWRTPQVLSTVTDASALYYRTARTKQTVARLTKAEAEATDLVSQHALASALATIHEFAGDAQAAQKARARSGCVEEAWVSGPSAWETTAATARKSALGAGALPESTPGPFGVPVKAQISSGHGCDILLHAASASPGTRDVVVDVDVAEDGPFTVFFRSPVAGALYVDGDPLLVRGYELGPRDVLRYATGNAKKGTHRIVVRAASTGSERIGLSVMGGKPHAPGSQTTLTHGLTGTKVHTAPFGKTAAEHALYAAYALAIGDVKSAEKAGADKGPEASLVYGRALASVDDLSSVDQIERARAAYERVLAAWPTAWEAILEHAELAGKRRAPGEAALQALRDLDKLRTKDDPILDVYDAAQSAREKLYDRKAKAMASVKKNLGGTHLGFATELSVADHVGKDHMDDVCQASPLRNYGEQDCYSAKLQVGDRKGAREELARLGTLLGKPREYAFMELRQSLIEGDLAGARKAFETLTPGERTLASAFLVATDKGPDLEKKLRAMLHTADGGVASLPPLLRVLEPSPLARYEGLSEKLCEADRKDPAMKGGGTVLLRHDETYDVDPGGLVHYVLYDLRRVSSTTDVEENAQAASPRLLGDDTMRVVRRRILKKDGRIVEPEPTPNAAQAHADLSQLETLDYVEAIYEGWALPDDSWNLGFDSPDLLPERTSIKEANLKVTLATRVGGVLHAHASLGAPQETKSEGSRTLAWQIKDRSVRRLEEGVPRMDQHVALSFTTATWTSIASAVAERLATLEEHSEEVDEWARVAAATAGNGKEAPKPRAIVDAVVRASGEAVKQAIPSMLSDYGGSRGDGVQTLTARTILGTREGSRTWLIARALRSLGIPTDIWIAEADPWSADPAFPPHPGRFMHPLAVVHLTEDGKSSDLLLDADVLGPPLPPGRVSPELRGRKAMAPATGAIVDMPVVPQDNERDEVDIRLTLDAEGNAKGELTVLLRGRAAQELSEALVRIVGVERDRALRGVALGWLPFATVDDVTLSSAEGSWQVALRASLTIGSFAQREGSAWVLPGLDPVHGVFPRPYTSTLSASYASQGSRENAFAVTRAMQYHVRRRVELPAGFKIARVPSAFEVKTAAGKGTLALRVARKIEVGPKGIDEDYALDLATGTVSREHFGQFVSDLRRADDGFLSSIWVSGPPPAKKP